MSVGPVHYLVLSACLFAIGALGAVARRNLLNIYMSLELMLNGANLALVAFSKFRGDADGQILVFFVITVAAAEAAVGLALVTALFRAKKSAYVEDWASMRW